MWIDASWVLTFRVAGQGSGLLGSSSNSCVQTSVGVAVRIVGASLGIYSGRELVTASSVADFIRLDRSVRLRLGLMVSNGGGNWSGLLVVPLTELILNVGRGKVPDVLSGGSVPLRLRSGIPLWLRGGIPLWLRSGIPLRLRLGRSCVPLGLRLSRSCVPLRLWGSVQSGGYSGHGMRIPQGIVVDWKGRCRLRIVQTSVVAYGEIGAECRIHTSWELGGLLSRHCHEGHRHKRLEEFKKIKRTH